MATASEQSRAHVVLEAVRYASNANIPALRQLIAQRPDALKLEFALRILLTYLPVTTEPELYLDLLYDLSGALSDTYNGPLHSSPAPLENGFSDDEARLRVKSLRLTPLIDQQARYDQDADFLTLFLLRQAHRIDSETGSLDLVTQLLEPFIDHSEVLRTWMVSNLLPLVRLGYEYYGRLGPSYTLERFEEFDASIAVQSLLSRAAHREFPKEADKREGKTQEEEEEEGKERTRKEEQRLRRDLRGLVGPWMYGETTRKRRKLNRRSMRKSSISEGRAAESKETAKQGLLSSDWSSVNDWLLDLSLRDFQWSVKVVEQWHGPSDVDYGDWVEGTQQADEEILQNATYRYAQAGLAAFYATSDHSTDSATDSNRIIKRVAQLTDLDKPPGLDNEDIEELATSIASGVSHEYLDGLFPAHLLHNALLRQQNPFTYPTDSSMNLALLLNVSCHKLCDLGIMKTSKSVAELCLFTSEADQLLDLRRTLQKLKSDKLEADRKGEEFPEWASTRRRILWLWGWGQQAEGTHHLRGVFSKIAKTDLEHELLQAMLDEGRYEEAVKIYCAQASQPLPMATVEGTAMNAALSSYDAASNCSRERGGVLKAFQIIEAFGSYFPDSKGFSQTLALIAATHGISMYSLTLQHGVPFQPVKIRAHKDPISLIGKILEQNNRSYTQLDNLLEIGQNLLAAGLLQGSQQTSPLHSTPSDFAQESAVPQRRILQMAIEAALKQDDFDTAYSYLVTRLSSVDQSKLSPRHEPVHSSTQDDISWRVTYHVGSYNAASTEKISALRRIEQRMELLSQALLLAPTPALAEILDAWGQCEQQLNAQIAREADEDERHDARGDRKIPGGFDADSSHVIQKPRNPARSALAEEAPMGLFDVARGAAAALSKSAFPLRGPQQRETTKLSHGRPLSTASIESSDEGSVTSAGGQGRVRKRDMVSSMVTGGLASGIGWVIGKSENPLRGLHAE